MTATATPAPETDSKPRRGRKSREISAEEAKERLQALIGDQNWNEVRQTVPVDQQAQMDREYAERLLESGVPFQRSDFNKDEMPIFYEMRALQVLRQAEERARDLRAKAQEARAHDETTSKKRKFENLVKKIAKLKEELGDAAEGIDIQGLLQNLL